MPGQVAYQVGIGAAKMRFIVQTGALTRLDRFQVVADGGLWAGVAQLGSYGVDGGVNIASQKTFTGVLDQGLGDAASGHDRVLMFISYCVTYYVNTYYIHQKDRWKVQLYRHVIIQSYPL